MHKSKIAELKIILITSKQIKSNIAQDMTQKTLHELLKQIGDNEKTK